MSKVLKLQKMDTTEHGGQDYEAISCSSCDSQSCNG
ncbi:class III lanthipeptide [Kitasatospora sp. NPDC048540]|nr:class III lanthipeptide [Kitasatospora sp. MBT63]